nr:ThuA domain-containing protein [Flavihumibacter fluvii]
MSSMLRTVSVMILLAYSMFSCAQEKKTWVTYPGNDGPGKGRNIVFVSGDEEYRSEEGLPMLAQILAVRYGFNCTVLFSTDPKTGEIDARYQTNITGLEHLQKADLLVMLTRFRELPDAQMKYFDEYVKAGKPVIGLRTATHPFNYSRDTAGVYAKYSFNSEVPGWEGGFGKLVLGETWINHHGIHGKEGTRGLINGIEQDGKNPILNGVKDIWTPTDVYSIQQLTRANILVYGQSTNGMTPTAPVNLEKSVMPVAWTRTYQVPGGREGKAFATTMGAAVDLLNEDLRRLIVNACFWAVGIEKQIPEKANVSFIKDFKPTMFGFDNFKKGSFPSKYEMK